MSLFLGCLHQHSEQVSPWTGRMVRVIKWDMESFLRSCVDDYCKVAGLSGVRTATTPFLDDNHRDSSETEHFVRGELADVAARVLMKLLYAARCARYDLLHSIQRLACFITT